MLCVCVCVFSHVQLFVITWTVTHQTLLSVKFPRQESWSELHILMWWYTFSSVAQLGLTLCDPMDCSMPGLPVHHQLLELAYSNSCPSSQWYHPTISSSVVPFSSHLQSFPASGYFQISQLFASGGQSIGVSALASVLSMNIQDWCLLGGTGWISLQFKWLTRVFSNTTVQKHQFFGS